ncbi:uncharacterized protein LOC113236971 [Hyposmocoma kahamanoa]|uniref:uncharacterized protein LOC113236971 n=1 Tax=Hyposmocoma kahamanoa TaxID=1477025 RepID=UPI000E6D5B8A|nr:uncharacterized protein LOC113236971 [Hyposmocoma kahamanoa]
MANRRGVSSDNIPNNPVINNLNSLLQDIYVRYVALNDDEFETYYGVFTDVFRQIHTKMKQVDPYFERYSSNVLLAGSHYDRTRVTKPDEFDVAIVIGLPLNERAHPEDVALVPKEAGYVHLRMGTQYKQLMMRDSCNWEINNAAYKWSDGQDFLLRSYFMDWFKGVVDIALNLFKRGSTPIIYSGDVPYTIRQSESGPAKTLIIENISKGFKLDVDLVPALKFPEERWPITNSYRLIRANWSNAEKFWLVVPKQNKNAGNDTSRYWRLGLVFKINIHLLLKKLRDAQDMDKIASYFLKNLVLWEIVEREHDRDFWTQNPAALFTILVRKLYNALKTGKLLYFWNSKDNLFTNIHPWTLSSYAAKLERLLEVLARPGSYKEVAKYLLTASQFHEYNYKFLHI